MRYSSIYVSITLSFLLMGGSAYGSIACSNLTGEQVRQITCESKQTKLEDGLTYKSASADEPNRGHCSTLRSLRDKTFSGVLVDLKMSGSCRYDVPKKWAGELGGVSSFSISKKRSLSKCPSLNFSLVYLLMKSPASSHALDGSGELWELSSDDKALFEKAYASFTKAHGSSPDGAAAKLTFSLGSIEGAPDIASKTCKYKVQAREEILVGTRP